MKFNILDYFALVLLFVGGLNWGLIGLINFDLVSVLLMHVDEFIRIVHILVGLSALYSLYILYRIK